MNTSKPVWICVFLAMFAGAGTFRAAETPPTNPVVWETDYARALAQAKTEHKRVLLDFTGSDWCIWCHRLDNEILTQPAFADYARRQLVLVEVDFPQHKAQDPALTRQNRKLADQFGVTGYPTLVVVDGEGRECGRTGYIEGGPKTFVRMLKRFADATTH